MILRRQFPANKINWKNDQRGVTLLLSILVLSALTSIVFSVAAIAVNETRVSGDLLKTEPAITAAEAGTEDLLYYAVRGVGTYSTDCTAPTISTLNGVQLSICANPYLANPYQFTVGPKVGLVNGERDFFLYNPITQGGAPGYTNISINLISGVSATVDICTWANTNCVGAPDVVSLALTTGQTKAQVLDPNTATGYQVIFLNANSTSDGFSVTTTPNGIPSGTSTLEATGANKGVTRKIQTILPQ